MVFENNTVAGFDGPWTYGFLSDSRTNVSYLAGLALLVLLYTLSKSQSHSKLPELNPRRWYELTDWRRIIEFRRDSVDILSSARIKFPSQPCTVVCDLGLVVIIPTEYTDALRNDPRLQFLPLAKEDSHGYIPGLEPFDLNEALSRLVTKYLTRGLAKWIDPITDETSLVLREVLTDSTEWHEVKTMENLTRIISRITSRVFLGAELCRDETWYRTSCDYTINAFFLGEVIRAFPRWSRPFVHWLLPPFWTLRRQLQDARDALSPLLRKREELIKLEKNASGAARLDDSFQWFEQEYKEALSPSFDPAAAQISLSIVAIHTTTDMLQQAMLDLATHPALFEPLRHEIVEVIGSQGFNRAALADLKLMDSVLKESQRMKPLLLTPFRRLCLQDITLPNGVVVPKGSKIAADASHMMRESTLYADPMRFDGYRFLRMRDQASAGSSSGNSHLLTTTTSSHIGFGHGVHACPGRFFAAAEIKVALCYLLMWYDWKLPEDRETPKMTVFGTSLLPDMETRFMFRKRSVTGMTEDEINLPGLGLGWNKE